MSVPELVGAVVAVLGVLGGAVRWLLTWVLGRLETMQDKYLAAQAAAQASFLAAQKESEERWLKRDRELQDELRKERSERLSDHRQHSVELRGVIAEFSQIATAIKSRRPPASQ